MGAINFFRFYASQSILSYKNKTSMQCQKDIMRVKTLI